MQGYTFGHSPEAVHLTGNHRFDVALGESLLRTMGLEMLSGAIRLLKKIALEHGYQTMGAAVVVRQTCGAGRPMRHHGVAQRAGVNNFTAIRSAIGGKRSGERVHRAQKIRVTC